MKKDLLGGGMKKEILFVRGALYFLGWIWGGRGTGPRRGWRGGAVAGGSKQSHPER